MPVPLTILAVAILVTFLAATIQGAVGLGFGMLSVPILTLLDPSLTPVPQLLVTIPLTVAMVYGERHAIEWRAVARMSVARVPGVGLGIVLISLADGRLLDLMIAVTVLGAVAVIQSGVTVHRNRTSEIVAGAVSGTTSTISSIGGPPLALLYRNDSGPTVRANLAAIYFTGIVTVLIARGSTGHVASTDFVVALWLVPAVMAGWLLARRFHGRINGEILRTSILGLSALAGAVLLIRTVLG